MKYLLILIFPYSVIAQHKFSDVLSNTYIKNNGIKSMTIESNCETFRIRFHDMTKACEEGIEKIYFNKNGFCDSVFHFTLERRDTPIYNSHYEYDSINNITREYQLSNEKDDFTDFVYDERNRKICSYHSNKFKIDSIYEINDTSVLVWNDSVCTDYRLIGGDKIVLQHTMYNADNQVLGYINFNPKNIKEYIFTTKNIYKNKKISEILYFYDNSWSSGDATLATSSTPLSIDYFNYEYDTKGRVIKQEIKKRQGESYNTITYFYKDDLLVKVIEQDELSEKDKTTYSFSYIFK
jgi:hypothetical protein